jgi:hypothetical protein
MATCLFARQYCRLSPSCAATVNPWFVLVQRSLGGSARKYLPRKNDNEAQGRVVLASPARTSVRAFLPIPLPFIPLPV